MGDLANEARSMLDEHGTISPELLRRLMVAYGDVDRADRAEIGSVLLYAMPAILARLDALAPLEATASVYGTAFAKWTAAHAATPLRGSSCTRPTGTRTRR